MMKVAFALAKLDLISCVHRASFVILPKQLKYSTFSNCFLSFIFYIGDGCLEIFITLVFPMFISIPQHLPISVSLAIKSCSTASSLASSTRSSAYLTLQITCPILKSPESSRTLMVRYLLYKLNRISDKQHPYLTPLPVFTLLIFRWSSFSSTL